MTIDIDAIRAEWLRHCGLCDAGLLTECTCPKGDVRALITTLCDRVDELTAELDAQAIAAEQNWNQLQMVKTLDSQEIARLNAEVARLTAELHSAEREAVFGVADTVEKITNVRALCDQYRDQPPPIFQGPGLSERGEGYNAGTRDMARAVLDTLTEAVDR